MGKFSEFILACFGCGEGLGVWVVKKIQLVPKESCLVLFVCLVFASHAKYWLPYQFYPWVAFWN